MNLHIKNRALARLRQLKAVQVDSIDMRDINALLARPAPVVQQVDAERLHDRAEEIVEILRHTEYRAGPHTEHVQYDWPRTHQQWREQRDKLRAEQAASTKVWRRQLLSRGLARVAALLSAAGTLIAASAFGDVPMLTAMGALLVVAGVFYYEKTKGASAVRAAADKEGVVAGGGEPKADGVLPGAL